MAELINRAWDRFVFLAKFSIFGRACSFLFGFFGRLIQNSGIYRLTVSKNLQTAIFESWFYKALQAVFSIFTLFYEKVGRRLMEESALVRLFGGFSKLFENVLKLILELVRGSFLYRLVMGRKTDEKLSKFKSKDFLNAYSAALMAALTGLCALLGTELGAIAFCGILGALIVLKRPEVGIFAAVFLAPFSPTMALAGLLLYTFAAFILHLMFTGKYSFKLGITGVFVILFGIMLLIFSVSSYAVSKSVQIALLECLFLSGFLLIGILIDSKKKAIGLIFTFVTSALLTGFYGIYQYLGGHTDTTWTDTTLFEGVGRVYSTFGNPNVYGEYLLLAIPLAVSMIFISSGWFKRLYYGGTAAVLLVCLGLTYSRGCYLALLLASVVFIYFAEKRLFILAVPAVAALPMVLPDSIIDRFASITNFSDTSTSYRLNIWIGTLKMLTVFWPLGIGLGQEAFQMVYPKYALSAIVAPHSHSLFLQIFTEMGIAGFITFLLLIFCFMSSMMFGMREATKKEKILFSGFLWGVIAFMIQGIFDYSFYNYRVFLLFFLMLGLGAALSRIRIKEGNIFD